MVVNPRFMMAFAALAIALGGCGLTGGGSSDSSGPGISQLPPPDLDTVNPPFTVASSDDLALWYCHVHQDYYSNPRNFAFYFSVHSTFDHDISNVEWAVRRIDGSPAQSSPIKVIATVKAGVDGGDGHDYSYEWSEQAPAGRHYYELVLDPNNKIAEAKKSNNRYVFVVDVPGSSTPAKDGDLEFYGREAHVHCMMPSDQFDVHFELRNSSDHDMDNVEWRLQCPDIGFDQTFTIDKIKAQSIYGDVPPLLQQILSISSQGLHDITLTIDPNNHIAETNEANNVRVFHILVGPPDSSG
jgi:hypothetical protein